MSTTNEYAVQDKVAIVTGAGSGIGRAIARAFLANGAIVVVTGRRREPLEETVTDARNGHALVVAGDVSRLDESTSSSPTQEFTTAVATSPTSPTRIGPSCAGSTSTAFSTSLGRRCPSWCGRVGISSRSRRYRASPGTGGRLPTTRPSMR